MKTHDLKILSCYFDAQVKGLKNFEIRKNDRDFKVGDSIVLNELEQLGLGKYEETGRRAFLEITYIISDGFEGVEEGFCVLGTTVV